MKILFPIAVVYIVYLIVSTAVAVIRAYRPNRTERRKP